MSKAPHLRILIADDSAASCGVLVILLENAGYEVVGVYDGYEALLSLQGHPFALAIINHQLSSLDGMELLIQVRRFLPALPVIVCASAITPQLSLRYRDLGITELLSKPVDPRALRDKVVQKLGHPLEPAAALPNTTLTPFGRMKHATDSALPSPLIAGTSRISHQLKSDLQRLRDFRSVAILEGPHGCGRFEIAINIASPTDVHKAVCHADEFNAALLDNLLKPAHADTFPVLLVMMEADRLDHDRQVLLEDLMRSRLAPHAELSKRLRLILCAQSSLCDLHFNEFLLLRATTSTYTVPAFADRRMDWPDIARAILHRTGSGQRSFADEAVQWIREQTWPGHYMQLHRTIELARRLAGVIHTITVAHLEAALTKEPDFADPLFHDFLFHVHSGGEI
ncbi:MAG: response regulator [Opitutaceae bacterium]|jgi:DNA-binding NtrC family response regulator